MDFNGNIIIIIIIHAAVIKYLSFHLLIPSNYLLLQQEIWYSYAFSAAVGILEALYEYVTQIAGNWGLTGDKKRYSFTLEFYNIFVVSLLSLLIVFKLVLLLGGSDLITAMLTMGASFFAGTIVVQMWPIVSMSIYEIFWNSHRAKRSIVELRRVVIPDIFIFFLCLSVLLLLGIFGSITC
jgi:hypothetical protein